MGDLNTIPIPEMKTAVAQIRFTRKVWKINAKSRRDKS
jgi:hypothetical protein